LTHSRKFWASFIALILTLALWYTGEINSDQFSKAILWIAGVFTGAVAVEDGLRNLLSVWIVDPNASDDPSLRRGAGDDTLGLDHTPDPFLLEDYANLYP
jgi:hypothetical protein